MPFVCMLLRCVDVPSEPGHVADVRPCHLHGLAGTPVEHHLGHRERESLHLVHRNGGRERQGQRVGDDVNEGRAVVRKRLGQCGVEILRVFHPAGTHRVGTIQDAFSLRSPASAYGNVVAGTLRGFLPHLDRWGRPAGVPDLEPLGRVDVLVGATRARLVRIRDRARAAEAAA